jgi:hypothetical protein
MAAVCRRALDDGIRAIAFGDLFLQDIRDYRERQLQGTGLEPLFPLWHLPTRELASDMLAGGVRAKITCVDPRKLDGSFAGREFDRAFLDALPPEVDPCGENGEFHTFVYAAPVFSSPIPVHSGEIVERDGFVFADVVPEFLFADYCKLVEERIERHYGIRIVTRDIPDPLTGDLDGAEIHVDYSLTPEQRLFLLAHLFGHTVQWNLDPRASAMAQPQIPVSERLLQPLLDYEAQAAGYGLALLHESGVTAIDQWFSDHSACDQAYLSHFYRTGEKRAFRSFWRDRTRRIEPRKVPPFTPTKQVSRMDGIVI